MLDTRAAPQLAPSSRIHAAFSYAACALGARECLSRIEGVLTSRCTSSEHSRRPHPVLGTRKCRRRRLVSVISSHIHKSAGSDLLSFIFFTRRLVVF